MRKSDALHPNQALGVDKPLGEIGTAQVDGENV